MNDWKNKVKEQHNAVLYFYLAIANHALVCYIVALKHRAKICKVRPVFLCHRGNPAVLGTVGFDFLQLCHTLFIHVSCPFWMKSWFSLNSYYIPVIHVVF